MEIKNSVQEEVNNLNVLKGNSEKVEKFRPKFHINPNKNTVTKALDQIQ
jgi:hypothetical protein